MRIPAITLILCAVFAWQHRDAIEQWWAPPPVAPVAGGNPVVLYATAWCGYCARTRALLSARKIPYREYDIETSSEGRAQYERLNGHGVPLIVVRDTVIRGFNEEAINAAIARL